MAVKMRLQRHGRKGYAYYHIVIADSRAPRDGKFIERIGSYNPNTNPATVDLKFDRALYWLNVGAQPTDTTRTILSNEGVLMMKHLQGGVKKGAFDEAEAMAEGTMFIVQIDRGEEQNLRPAPGDRIDAGDRLTILTRNAARTARTLFQPKAKVQVGRNRF